MKKNSIFNFLYLSLWSIPLIFFIQDFFIIDELKNINYKEILDLFKISFIQSSLSVLIAFIIAIIPSYYVSINNGNLSKKIENLIFIPFFFPVISTVIAFTLIFNSIYLEKFKILYTLKAIILANAFYNTPIIVKYMGEGLKSINKSISEAAKLDGANEVKIFFKIKLPLIFPQIFRGIFLVFIYCFLSFGVVLALGGIKYSNLEVEISNSIIMEANFSKALVLGGSQFLFLLFINYLGEKLPTYTLTGESEKKECNFFVKIYSYIYLIIEYLIVFIGVSYGFFNVYTGKFTLKYFFILFDKEFNMEYPVIKACFNSLFLSGITPIVVIFFSYLLLKNHKKITSIIIFSTLGISGAFLGITLIYLNILFNIKLEILLFLGYFLISVPIAYSFMYNSIINFSEEILDLIKLDRLNIFQKFFYIEFPILKNIFIATYLQIFAIIFGEFTISYTMQLENIFPTISLVNYSLYANKKFLEGASLSSLNILIILILFFISNRIKLNSKNEH